MISDLAPVYNAAVNGGGASAEPADTSASKAGGPTVIPARAGGILSAQPASCAIRGTIIDHAKKIVIREILELIGHDLPCVRLHAKYLDKQTLTDLCGRRDRIREEQLTMPLAFVKRERLAIQPELFDGRKS